MTFFILIIILIVFDLIYTSLHQFERNVFLYTKAKSETQRQVKVRMNCKED